MYETPFPVVRQVGLQWATDLPNVERVWWRKIREKKEETPLDELCAGQGLWKGATLPAKHVICPRVTLAASFQCSVWSSRLNLLRGSGSGAGLPDAFKIFLRTARDLEFKDRNSKVLPWLSPGTIGARRCHLLVQERPDYTGLRKCVP